MVKSRICLNSWFKKLIEDHVELRYNIIRKQYAPNFENTGGYKTMKMEIVFKDRRKENCSFLKEILNKYELETFILVSNLAEYINVSFYFIWIGKYLLLPNKGEINYVFIIIRVKNEI